MADGGQEQCYTRAQSLRPSSRQSDECDSTRLKSVTCPSVFLESSYPQKMSYCVNVLYRMEMMQRVIKQTQNLVTKNRVKLQESLAGMEEENQLVNEVECLQMKTRLLREEINNAYKKLDYYKHEKVSFEDDVSERGIEMSTRFQKLKREREILNERRKKLEELRQKLMNTNERLTSAKKELLTEIGSLYPISPLDSNKDNFTICDTYLPNAEEFGGHDLKAVSVALGYVCHCLVIISKLLDIPLRYAIIYYGSRSLVYDHINQRISNSERVFPTFIRKNKEKILFDYGVYLINKNIAQLRQNLGLATTDLRKTLPNLYSLFQENLFQAGTLSPEGNPTAWQTPADSYLHREIEMTSKLLNLSSSPASSPPCSSPRPSRSLSVSLDEGLNELNIKPITSGDHRRHHPPVPENSVGSQCSCNGMAYNYSEPQLCHREPVSIPTSEDISRSPANIGALEWLAKHADSSDGLSSTNSSPRLDSSGNWRKKPPTTILPSPSNSTSF